MGFSEEKHQSMSSNAELPHKRGFRGFVTYDPQNEYINVRHFFTITNNEIPNVTYVSTINFGMAVKWFEENYQHITIEKYKREAINLQDKKTFDTELLYVVTNGTMICIADEWRGAQAKIYYDQLNIDFAEKLVTEIRVYMKERQSRANIYLLIDNTRGLKIEPLTISNPNLILADNYNDDFLKIHDIIYNRVNKPNDKGLVLLHGKPGTGKTTYIRHLITSLKKKVIFLPPNMAAAMTNPELLSMLINNPNSVLVVEDAENILMNREQNGASPVSALLNLTDGLLSDCLNIQVICSFNTDLSNLDAALLRKGRLIAKYEFKPLEIVKAQKLANKLGVLMPINQPKTLAEIYNYNELDFKAEQRSTIGFG